VKVDANIDHWGELNISLVAETASEAARMALFGMNANADSRRVSKVGTISPSSDIDQSFMQVRIYLPIRRDCIPGRGNNRVTLISRP